MLKRKHPLRRASKKREQELKVYHSLKAYILSQRPYCERPGCLQEATQIHHVKGRAGHLLCDVTFWMALCQPCHTWIHSHAKLAREAGLLKF